MGSPQQQAMLAVLLLRVGQTATATDLLSGLWGDDGPRSAITTLRTYAWRLRKALEKDSKTPQVLLSLGDGYRLDLTGCTADFLKAEELAHEARRLRQSGDVEGAFQRLEQTLALWRGTPLTAVPGPFAERERERFEEFRLRLQEERIDAALAMARGPEHTAELVSLVQAHPLRERLVGLLMRAHYQSARQAEALAAYRRTRQLLIDELGIEPGPELKALHDGILRGSLNEQPAAPVRTVTLHPPATAATATTNIDADTDTVVGTPEEETGPANVGLVPVPAGDAAAVRFRPPAPVPAQLPPGPSDFTGRAHSTVTLCSALNVPTRTSLPIVAMVGMGGVGKTSLALHVAHQVRDFYPDGQLYADLRGAGEPAAPEAVLAGFLTALGLAPVAIPEGVEARAALFRTMTDRRRILVVLDDARDAAQVRPLLPGTAMCGVLITSRTRLAGLPAAVQTELPPFSTDEALDLLALMIGRERVDTERDSAVTLVSQCSLLPLAVRIVATRLAARPSWSIASIVQRLADEHRRIDELKVGELTVDAVFEVGYRQLTVEQARVLQLVSTVETSSLSANAASALLGVGPPEAEELLEGLVDVGMLQSPAPGVYRLHDLLRAFARRKVTDDILTLLRPLVAFQLASALSAFENVVAGDPVRGALQPREATGLRFTSVEQARAWAMAEGESALLLAGQIAGVVLSRPAHEADGHRPGGDLLRSAVSLCIALSPFRTDLHSCDWAGVFRLFSAAAAHCDDLTAEARAHFLSGNNALATCQLAEAERETTLAIRQCQATDDVVIQRQALNDLGLVRQLQGRYEEAIACFDEAVTLARQLGHRSGEATSVINSALVRVYNGQPAEAVEICDRVLRDRLADHDSASIAYAQYVLGFAHHTLEDFTTAVGHYESSLAMSTLLGLRRHEANARYRLAKTLLAVGSLQRAFEEASAAAVLCESIGDTRNQAQALLVLSALHERLGDPREAEGSRTRAQEMFARLGLAPDGKAPAGPESMSPAAGRGAPGVTGTGVVTSAR
ncbi:BTAD domain-containing putative transcriptional regulator [Streptomyces sp. NPDC046870]|uniref:AfsR/SARP family transcriptional regulator n=1 Tax=Streptomyces sp. NPDC046870 TaxID=3155135 RepID=UPI003453CE1B